MSISISTNMVLPMLPLFLDMMSSYFSQNFFESLLGLGENVLVL